MSVEFEHRTSTGGGSSICVNGYEVATLADSCNSDIPKAGKRVIRRAAKLISAAPDMYRDLVYLMTILRSMPSDVIDQAEQGEGVDFDRVTSTLRKAGYEQTQWPLRQVP